jgi:hypothetical protein
MREELSWVCAIMPEATNRNYSADTAIRGHFRKGQV